MTYSTSDLIIELANDLARAEQEKGWAIKQREDWQRSCMEREKGLRQMEGALRALLLLHDAPMDRTSTVDWSDAWMRARSALEIA
jgi:hypothetical protein